LWLPPERAVYEIEDDSRRRETFTVTGEDQIAHMLEDFGRAVIEKHEATPSAEEAVRTLRVLDALAQSAREGRAIEVKRE
jgi:predicted dehydrogenase